VLKYPGVCLEISVLLPHLLGEQLCPISYTLLDRQNHFHHLTQKSIEQRKEIRQQNNKLTFDSRLPIVGAPVVRSLFCPSSQNLIKKVLHEITVNTRQG